MNNLRDCFLLLDMLHMGSLDPYNLDEEKDNVYIMDPLGARHPHDVWKCIVNA
ncbi:unnamed protein product [Prunus armeniaca]|uniref:Uncharacterized protein n=1 Tax=Prunus armeniaca TaxID=36596 RepID=A0A6J5VH59_PRUAR|nr:unnamed protein product [Prunus armeniaca]